MDDLNAEIAPLLLAQGLDMYYAKSGLEYIAYENWRAASEAVEGAEEVLAEVAEDEPALQFEWDEAKYELDRANNRSEYEERRAIFDDVNDRLNSLLDKKNTA